MCLGKDVFSDGWEGGREEEIKRWDAAKLCHQVRNKIGAALKNKHPSTLRSPLRLKGSNRAWEISKVQAMGLVHKAWTHTTYRDTPGLGNIFNWTLYLRSYTQWGFHIYLQYSPWAVFCSFTLQTMVIMSALSMLWRNLKHVNTTGRCTGCISAVFTSMINLYCAK